MCFFTSLRPYSQYFIFKTLYSLFSVPDFFNIPFWDISTDDNFSIYNTVNHDTVFCQMNRFKPLRETIRIHECDIPNDFLCSFVHIWTYIRSLRARYLFDCVQPAMNSYKPSNQGTPIDTRCRLRWLRVERIRKNKFHPLVNTLLYFIKTWAAHQTFLP